jgi:hypothetical protein
MVTASKLNSFTLFVAQANRCGARHNVSAGSTSSGGEAAASAPGEHTSLAAPAEQAYSQQATANLRMLTCSLHASSCAQLQRLASYHMLRLARTVAAHS